MDRSADGHPVILAPTAPPTATSGEGPRSDVDELARMLGGRVLVSDRLPGLAGALERGTGRLGHWHLARRARRARPPVIVSLAEKIGMCVSLLDVDVPHVVVAHNLTTPRRRAFQRATRWLARPDRIVVLSTPQEAYLRTAVGLPPGRVRRLHHHVDDRFFRPQGAGPEGYVLAVGQAGRDYATLFEAVRAGGVPTVVVASSPWTGGRRGPGVAPPPNVTLRHGLSSRDLRDLYDRASVVVVPLRPGVEWAAGTTALLEAMAMAKPVVVSRVPGLDGYVVNGTDGRCVPAGEPQALREAITGLLDDRSTADGLARAARARVESELNLDAYVSALAGVVHELVP